MKAGGGWICIFIFIFPWVLARPSKCGEEEAASLFIFGDSFLDAGNNNYINTTTLDQSNFWPYGKTFFHFPTGRFSDGRLISDFIAEYAKLELIPPFLQPGIGVSNYENGVNFASAGAGALLQTFQGSVINLKTQLRNYRKVESRLRKELGSSSSAEAKKRLARGVYLFGIGTNDYTSLYITNSTAQQHKKKKKLILLNSHYYSHSQYVGMVIGNITSVIREIYKSGGRKFGFLNLGPLGCLPGLRIIIATSDQTCFHEEASLLAKLHNQELSKSLSRMANHLPGFKYTIYDFNTNLQRRINRPSSYGFKEGETACCGTGFLRGRFSCGGKRPPVKEFELCDHPNQYVFWDSYHLTERVYAQMAAQMWFGDTSATNHPNYSLRTLFHNITS